MQSSNDGDAHECENARGSGRGSSRGRGRGRKRGTGAGASTTKTAKTARGRGRGRGRGQGRGRGRGRGSAQSVISGDSGSLDALSLIRAQKKITKSHVANLTPEARAELTARKRINQLDRILLPDAPPRKRPRRTSSPERNEIDFLPSKPAPVIDSNSEVRIRESGENAETETENVEVHDGGPIADGSTIEFYEIPEVRTNTTHQDPKPSSSKTVIGVNDSNFAGIVSDWMEKLLDNNSDIDDDDEFDKDKDVITIPEITSRTVNDNPVDNTGLSLDQIAVLQAEEQADDRYVRETANQDTCFDFKWTSDRQTFIGKRETFTGASGPTFPVTRETTIVQVFDKMFDDDFLELLVTETNRYADQMVSKLRQDPATKKNCRSLSWLPTNKSEMVSFLAVIILQGLYPKVNEESYFTFDGYGTTPYFGRIMSYNRYYLLKTFLHFTDNEKTDNTKLNKIAPIIEYFSNKFASLYTPGQEIAIDESLLKWHGRLGFAQKISTKAAQVGVKTYELCESSTGYLWAFRVYTGKKGPTRSSLTANEDLTDVRPNDRLILRTDQTDRLDVQDQEGDIDLADIARNDRLNAGITLTFDEGLDGQKQDQDRTINAVHNLGSSEVRPDNVTSKVVYDLVDPLLHRGHTLIMDNFYNSPLLTRCLKKNKTDVFGTLRLTREFVPDAIKTMTKREMRQGEVAASYCSDLAVMLWKDSNFVSMISTYHPLQVGTSNKYNRLVYKPAIVLDYNKYMGGVDRKDQFLASQPLERQKNKVWYKKLFRRLYNAALFNCFIIYTSNAIHKITHREFRKVLAETLLYIHRQIDIKTEPRLYRVPNAKTTTALRVHHSARPYIEGNHFPAKTGSVATRCWMCTRNKTPTRTAYKCEECNVNLCLIGCFKAYHKPPH